MWCKTSLRGGLAKKMAIVHYTLPMLPVLSYQQRRAQVVRRPAVAVLVVVVVAVLVPAMD
jgi:hypothetical protein